VLKAERNKESLHSAAGSGEQRRSISVRERSSREKVVFQFSDFSFTLLSHSWAVFDYCDNRRIPSMAGELVQLYNSILRERTSS
jgi:hypothetical protein